MTENKLGEVGETIVGIGHISQVKLTSGDWVSWQLWTAGDHLANATKHVQRLMASGSYVDGRVVRVDHTVVVVQAGRAAAPSVEGGHLPQSEKG